MALSCAPLVAQSPFAPVLKPISWLGLSKSEGDTKGCDQKSKSDAKGCACAACKRWTSWTNAEFLAGWSKGRDLPALVTTSPLGTPQIDSGVLGLPSTQTLFGGGAVSDGMQGGVRLDFGIWLDDIESLGLGTTIWGYAGDVASYQDNSANNPILARPFFNEIFSAEDSFLVAYPGLSTGSINARASNDIIGTDVYLRTNGWVGKGYNLDLFGGYEFMRVDDDVRIQSSSTIVGGGGSLPIGSTLDIFDAFDAHNEFHGGVFGAMSDIHYQGWKLTLMGKVAVGYMDQRVSISGQTVTDTGGGPATTNSGLLAQDSNIGNYAQRKIAYIPEFAAKMSYEVTDYLDITFGYHLTWWSSVVHAGDAIDLNVDPSQFIDRPEFNFVDTDFYMHTLSLGAAVRW